MAASMTSLSSKVVFVGLFVYFSYELSSSILKFQRQGVFLPHSLTYSIRSTTLWWKWVIKCLNEMNVALWFKMIGTNSVMESSAEILYPSISVCSERLHSIKVGENHSVFHPSLNLSDMIVKILLWQRNDTGQLQPLVIQPTEGKWENRENILPIENITKARF